MKARCIRASESDLYRARLGELEEKGLVYRCYATKEEMEAMRASQKAEGRSVAYDRRWRDKGPADWPADTPYVLRFKIPLEGDTVVDDQVQGRTVFKNTDLEDFVVARSDGTPTYNFVVVVDDIDLGISHIVRGVDHLTNTPLQINVYNALGATPPVFAHVGLIHGPDGKRILQTPRRRCSDRLAGRRLSGGSGEQLSGAAGLVQRAMTGKFSPSRK